MRSYDVAEVCFVLLLVAGVAFIYWPAAMILAGVLGIVACERGSTVDAKPSIADKSGSERERNV